MTIVPITMVQAELIMGQEEQMEGVCMVRIVPILQAELIQDGILIQVIIVWNGVLVPVLLEVHGPDHVIVQVPVPEAGDMENNFEP